MILRALPFALILSTAAAAGVTVTAVRPVSNHAVIWNRFAEAVFELHKKTVAGRDMTTTSTVGGYLGQLKFYKRVKYYDKGSGHLVSVIEWETVNPERIHSIETYVYDEKGRVIRDFSAWYLPHYRNAPRATYINFYSYNEMLRGYRQFDATDNRIYEHCVGSFEGKPVEFGVDELDLIDLADESDVTVDPRAYEACFEGLPRRSAGKYLTPS